MASELETEREKLSSAAIAADQSARVRQSSSAAEINWNNSVKMIAGLVLLLGLILSAAVMFVSPFAFLGMVGVLGTVLSGLFVLELTLATSALLHGLTTDGQDKLTKGLVYAIEHLHSPKLLMFIGGAVLLAVFFAALGPGGQLAMAAIPLFTAGTVAGSVVFVIAAAGFYVLAALLVERGVACAVTGLVNRFSASADLADSSPQELIGMLEFHTKFSFFGIMQELGVKASAVVAAEVVGTSSEQVLAGWLKGNLKQRAMPACINAMLTSDENIGDNGGSQQAHQ